jgi:holo-[acyl-carrier protein] synthase
MIKGIGVDIVEIARIENMISRYGEHFVNKVFSVGEIAYCGGLANPALHYAGRWAAKEAFYKALPLPLQGLSSWKSIEVLPCSDRGMPIIIVLDDALLEEMEKCNITSSFVSISHEKSYCIANVILE